MNPKDKNGNVLNVGDRVVYMKGTPEEDFGVITKFDDVFCNGTQRVYSLWSDADGHECHCDPESVELTESSPTTATFTQEDEAMLQKLLSKKEQALHVKMQAHWDFSDLVTEIRENVEDYRISEYLSDHIDKICTTLQAYKQHCM